MWSNAAALTTGSDRSACSKASDNSCWGMQGVSRGIATYDDDNVTASRPVVPAIVLVAVGLDVPATSTASNQLRTGRAETC